MDVENRLETERPYGTLVDLAQDPETGAFNPVIVVHRFEDLLVELRLYLHRQAGMYAGVDPGCRSALTIETPDTLFRMFVVHEQPVDSYELEQFDEIAKVEGGLIDLKLAADYDRAPVAA